MIEEFLALLWYVVYVLDESDDDCGLVRVGVTMEDLDDGDWCWGDKDEFLDNDTEEGLWVEVVVVEVEEYFWLLWHVVDVLDDNEDDGGLVRVEVMMKDFDDGDWLWDDEDGLSIKVMVEELEQ